MSNSPGTPPDRFPSLDEAFARRVQEGLEKRFSTKAPQISWEDWLRLKPSLAAYKEEAEYSRGFLNKGQAKQLRDVSQRAAKLIVALDRATASGLDIPVGEALDPLDHEKFLAILSNLETRFALDGKIAPDLVDMSRANLFSNFEAWWIRATGLPAAIKEGLVSHPTPFMYVANEVFNLHGMPGPVGATNKSLHDFRRANRDRFENVKKLADSMKKRGLLE